MALTWAGTAVIGALVVGGLMSLRGPRKPSTDQPLQPPPTWSSSPFGRLGFVLGLAGFMGYNYGHSQTQSDAAQDLPPPPNTFADATPPDTSSVDFSSGGDFT